MAGLDSTPHAGALLNIHAKVDTERRQLQRAVALLRCIGVALEYADSENEHGGTSGSIDFADAIDAARQIVDTVINALDSVALRCQGGAS